MQKFNLKQAAAKTGISVSALGRWCREGRIRAEREVVSGRTYLVIPADVVESLCVPNGYVDIHEAMRRSYYCQTSIASLAARGKIRIWKQADYIKQYYHLQDLIDWSQRNIHHDDNAAPQCRRAALRL